MSDALDGQAALDEANNEITRLRAKLAESERVIDFQREEMRAAVEKLKEQLHHLGSARDGYGEDGVARSLAEVNDDRERLQAEVEKLKAEVEWLRKLEHAVGDAPKIRAWIGRDQNGTYRVGLGDPPQPTIWPGPAGAARWWKRPGPTVSARQIVVCPLAAARICEDLGVALEPGEAHALELTALDYGWVMEEGSDE